MSIEKKCSDIGKNVLIFRIYKLSFSFKRGGSRTAATSKMERKPLTIIAKHFILDVAAVQNPPPYAILRVCRGETLTFYPARPHFSVL